MNKYLRCITSILPALAIAAVSFTAHAQGAAPKTNLDPNVQDLPFAQMGVDGAVLNAERVLSGSLSAHNLDGLRRHNLIVLATVGTQHDNKVCLVMASVAANREEAKGAFRMTSPVASAATDVKHGEEIGVACERAAAKAVSSLFGDSKVSDEVFKDIAASLELRQPAVKVGKRDLKMASIASLGTLSDEGKKMAAVALGDRWTMVVDHNILSALAVLMTAKTESGQMVCTVMTGMVPKAPHVIAPLIPDRISFFTSVEPTGQGCSDRVLKHAMRELRDNMADAYATIHSSKLAEKGVKYPSPAQFKKMLAEYDAKAEKEAKAAAAKAAKEAKSAKPSSKVVTVRCTTHCINGLCKRVFEDGRKDTVRAPSSYNFRTKLIEYDTSNICLL